MTNVKDSNPHPVATNRVMVFENAEGIPGGFVRTEFSAEAGGFAATHVHPHQEETFEIRVGVLIVVIDGGEHQFGPGEGTVVPAGIAHAWRNPGKHVAVVVAEHRPALPTGPAIESVAVDDKTPGLNPGPENETHQVRSG